MRAPLALTAIFLALAAAAAAQPAPQGPPQGTRISGTVKSVTAGDVVLQSGAGEVDVALTPQTRVLMREAATSAEITPGAYLGTSNQNSATGAEGTATEVHVMPNGPNVNYPMNNSGLMMTNGHVRSVTTTSRGQEMDVDYGQGAPRHVVVTGDTRVSRLVDVGAAGLKPGQSVSAVTNPGEGGKPTASYISINPPEPPPAPAASH